MVIRKIHPDIQVTGDIRFDPMTGIRPVDADVLAALLEDFLTIGHRAATKINELLTEENKSGSGLRVFVQGGGCSGFQYGLMIEENGQGAGDQVYESHGVKLFVDPISIRYLQGAEVDFVDTITGGGFTIKNPNATSTCGCGSSFSVE